MWSPRSDSIVTGLCFHHSKEWDGAQNESSWLTTEIERNCQVRIPLLHFLFQFMINSKGVLKIIIRSRQHLSGKIEGMNGLNIITNYALFPFLFQMTLIKEIRRHKMG